MRAYLVSDAVGKLAVDIRPDTASELASLKQLGHASLEVITVQTASGAIVVRFVQKPSADR